CTSAPKKYVLAVAGFTRASHTSAPDASIAVDAIDTCCLSILSHSPCLTHNALYRWGAPTAGSFHEGFVPAPGPLAHVGRDCPGRPGGSQLPSARPLQSIMASGLTDWCWRISTKIPK